MPIIAPFLKTKRITLRSKSSLVTGACYLRQERLTPSFFPLTNWCEANQLVLGKVRTASKGNEITAIKELLDTLVLAKADIIAIDAIECQLDIAKKIHSSGADYLLAVKQNQPNLADEVANFFDQATQATEYAPVMVHCHQKEERGRDDYRETWVTEDIEWLPQRLEWAGLSSLIMVYRKWMEKG